MPGKLSGKNIAIVGGGFTGLTAAYKMSQLGARVTIFEAGNVLGGLAAGCTILDTPVEKAYHFLYKTDKHMIRLLEELGLRDKLTYYKSSVSTYYGSQLYPMMNPIDLIKFLPLKFHNRIRAGLVVLYLQNVKNWRKLAEISAMEWLTKFAGKQVTDVIWEPLLRGKFDVYFDKVTMAWLWGRIKQRVDSRDKKAKGEVLGYIDGGFATIVKELIKKIEETGLAKFELNTPINMIEHYSENDAVKVTANNKDLTFDGVLLTVSCKVAERILQNFKNSNAGYFQKLEGIKYLDAAILLFATDKPITKYYWHNINAPNSPFVVFLSLTSLIGCDRFKGKHIYYIGDYVLSDHPHMNISKEDLEENWFKSLQKMFPDFDPTSVLEKKVYRFKDAQHIVDVGFEDKIPEYQTPCPEVYLCNFSQIYPMDRGTNYAVRDGFRMAELFEKRYG